MQVFGIVMTGLVSGNHDSVGGKWEVLTLRRPYFIYVLFSSYLTENAVDFD